MTKSQTEIVYSFQAVVVMVSMFMMVSAAIFGGIVYVHNNQRPAPEPRPRVTGEIGDISAMTAEAIEATYGPVNKKALLETKEGILFNRKQSHSRCCPCAQPQPQQLYLPVYKRFTVPCVPLRAITPVAPVVVPVTPVSPPVVVPVPPVPELDAPRYLRPSPLKIWPSCRDGKCNLLMMLIEERRDESNQRIDLSI